ncbi:MAG TPA: glycosyltransferase family 39 protein [Candidatus Acidoferrales bacterium]|nr:glycosyltransferase family 39 protein [Candidatus Acidoferrales bacterium]
MPGSPAPRDPALRRHLVAIVLIALAVRAGIGVLANGHGEMEGLADHYEQSAYALAAGYGYVRPALDVTPVADLRPLAAELARRGQRLTPTNAPPMIAAQWRPASMHPPGYALLLLLFYRTLGPPASVWARALQVLLDAGACALVVSIGRRFGGLRTGLLAGYVSALFLPLAYQVTSRVPDGIAPPLVVLLSWLFLVGLERRTVLMWSLAGVVSATLVLMRPDWALLPVCLLGGAALLGVGRRRLVTGGLAWLLVAAVLVLPWALHNRRAIHEFNPGSTATGMMLLQGVGMFPNPYGVRSEDGWYDEEARRAGMESSEDPRASRMFTRRFLEIVRRDPALFLRQSLERLALGLVPPYHWGMVNSAYEAHSYYVYRRTESGGPFAIALRHPLELLGAYWDRLLFVPVSLLLLLASIACLVHPRANRRRALVLLSPFLYVLVVHLPMFLTVRFLVPGVFVQWIALGVLLEGRSSQASGAAPLAVLQAPRG